MDKKLTLQDIEDVVRFKLLDCPYNPRWVAINANGQIWLFSEEPQLSNERFNFWELVDFKKENLDCLMPTNTEDGNVINLPDHISWKDCKFEL